MRLNKFSQIMPWRRQTLARGFKVALTYAVIFSTVLSSASPALAAPPRLVFDNEKLAAGRYQAEELVFKLLGATPTNAQFPGYIPSSYTVPLRDELSGVVVTDPANNLHLLKLRAEQDRREAIRQKIDQFFQSLKSSVFLAGKQSLDYFMQQMAYDTATWLASGGKGQQPMFYTEGWGPYLTNLADQAAGSFIEKLSGSWLGFGVCEPGASLKISIGLGLADIQRPRKPQCTAREMLNNWESAVNDKNFLNNISLMFEPEQNDIGIAFSIFGQYYDNVLSEMFTGTKEREAGGGWKAVKEKISKFIKTPESLVKARAESLVTDSQKSEWQKVQFGDIVTGAIATFVNTLAGKIFERLFTQGLVSSSSGDKNDSRGFLLPAFNREVSPVTDTSIAGTLGRESSQVRFLDLLQTGNKSQERPYDILTKLAFCPTPENPGPDECVIRPDFRLAIVNRLTLRDAMDQGLIDGDVPFGIEYDASALYRGLPLRSIIILRTFRVVPVGWEIAGQAINKFEKNQRLGLRVLTEKFNDPTSPYYQLVDPNWVLELPEHLCKAEGYGSKLVYSQISGGVDQNHDGDFSDSGDVQPQRLVGRATYCADYQSCIERNDDGSCKYYGYCQEDRRIWDLAGQSCPVQYNTCQTFQNPSGQQASYLKNSLNFNGCDVDNAGCQWYCRAFNAVSDQWVCDAPTERVVKACNQSGGCALTARCDIASGDTLCNDSATQVNLAIAPACGPGSKWWTTDRQLCEVVASCTIPSGGVSCDVNGCEALPNLLLNSGFEARPTVSGGITQFWNGNLAYFERVSGTGERIHQGANSIRFYNAGAAINEQDQKFVSQALVLNPGNKNYTFSIWVYNKLNAGVIDVSVGGVTKRSTVKNGWEQIGFDFDGSAETVVTIQVHGNGGQVSGSAWFDDARISESCVTSPITLSLIGTVEQNESKIHLDRDAATCDESTDGCSQFIRVRPNLGTNLVRNASFENWSDGAIAPPGWSIGEGASGISKFVSFSRAEGAPNLGSFSLKLLGIPDVQACRKFETAPILTMKPNTTYRVSFWARSDNEVTGSARNWYAEILSASKPNEHYCSRDILTPCNPMAVDDECAVENKGVCVPDFHQLTTNNSRHLSLASTWQRYVMDPVTTRLAGYDFKLSFNNCQPEATIPLYIDGVKVEEVATANPIISNYSDYGATNVVHLRQPPAYLACTGNPDTDPALCANYAPVCTPAEVGCEAYRPVRGGSTIPAVVTPTDYCPVECVGYEAYRQSATFFESNESLDYFIPKTARQCSAASVGCTEFTNLDEVAAGGEGREYYKYLRLCEASSAASCQNFYTWQGSEETGYQLRVYTLSANNDKPLMAIADPVDWPDQWCGDKTLDATGLPNCCNEAEDVLVNPFCKEFYGTDGNVSYQIYDNTISCSDNCHPYRKTLTGETGNRQANCEGSHGVWDDTSQECVYRAIPGQGLACGAAEASCREFRGNTGGNVFISLFDTFEDGETSGWQFGAISFEALSVGGHSLRSQPEDASQRVATFAADLGAACSDALPACSDTKKSNCYDQGAVRCVALDTISNQTCLVAVGERYCGQADTIFNAGKTYLLSFWAKVNASQAIDGVTVELRDADKKALTIGGTILDTDWRYYAFGPFVYEGDGTGPSARLIIAAPDNSPEFFIDNLQVKEVTDHVYVIRNSWTTPVSCDTNSSVSPPANAPQFMLGCEQYRDSAGRLHNLKSFDALCREEAVGCEALIDTHNSDSPFAEKFNVNDPTADITVPADNVTYLANRPEFQCPSQAQGCEVMGRPRLNTADKIVGFSSVYRVNDPDQYGLSLCESSEVGCEEFQTNDSFSYFKDPGAKICVYRQIPGAAGSAWFKTGSTSLTPDCPVSQPPVGPVHPDSAAGWAGLCSAEFSSCTEFIDPTSADSKNRLFNGRLDIDVNVDEKPDGWDNSDDTALKQAVELKAGVLYTFSFIADVNKVRNATGLELAITNCPGIISYDRSLTVNSNSAKIPSDVYENDNRTDQTVSGLPAERQYSGRFTVPDNQTCLVVASLVNGSVSAIQEKAKAVNVRESNISYTLETSVDKLSCNGLVNPEIGCVLFNDRGQVNYRFGEDDISSLAFDADVSGPGVNDGVGVTQCAGVCDANTVLKVRPERACESWLYCKTLGTFIDSQGLTRTYCAQLGQCDELDDNGVCASELSPRLGDDRFDVYTDRRQIQNMSGYSRPGLLFNAGVCGADSTDDAAGNSCDNDSQCAGGTCDKTIAGYFPYAEMTEQGQSARLANGSFEFKFFGSTEPVGWSTVDKTSPDDSRFWFDNSSPVEWFNYKFNVESDFSQVIDGTSYLRLNTFYEAVSEQIDVEPGQNYILSAQINTRQLSHPARAENQPSAQILLKAVDVDNQPIIINHSDCAAPTYGKWQLCRPFNIAAGLDWQRVNFEFIVPNNTVGLQLKLSNYVNDTGCIGEGRYQLNATSRCELGGYSLFDDLALKPVLEVGRNSADNSPDSVTRSCRLYPTVDALSCNYVKDDSIFFGKYGYCLIVDPFNPSQCLQWWPLDQIKGETPDEVTSGYSDRAPLDYCTDRESLSVRLSERGALARIGPQADDDVQRVFSDSGGGMNFVPFNLPSDDYAPLLRWPYVTSFTFRGTEIGEIDVIDKFFVVPFSAEMFYDRVCFDPVDLPLIENDLVESAIVCQGNIRCTTFLQSVTQGIDDLLRSFGNLFTVVESSRKDDICFKTTPWGGFAVVPFVLEWTADNEGGSSPFPGRALAFAIPLPWSVVTTGLPDYWEQINSSFNDEFSCGGDHHCGIRWNHSGFGTMMGTRIITDQDAEFGDYGSDGVPELEGDVLGAIWFLQQNDTDVTFLGNFDGNITVNYCREVVRVVTAAGSNKAYANRLSPGSGYVSNENLQSNPDWNARFQILPYLQCQEIDGNPDTANCEPNHFISADQGTYVYYKPFSYKDFLLCPCFYQASDYQPFGALVPPFNAQYPTAWDSRTSLYKQPLFYEPPLPSLSPPYQTRMGELHSPTALQQLFARTYGIWHWIWASEDEAVKANKAPEIKPERGGQYVAGASPTSLWTDSATPAIWNLPTAKCPDNVRPSDTYCFIKPFIDPQNIRVNDKTSTIITNGIGTVKLTFTVKVDPDQLPLTAYTIDWGDGDITSVAGVTLRNRANPDEPLTLYHQYDYWRMLKASFENNQPDALNCATENQCVTKISISAKDNWNAESGDVFAADSNGQITNITVQKR